MEMFVALIAIHKPGTDTPLVFAQVVVASDQQDAIDQAVEEVRAREFQSSADGFNVISQSATQIDHELIEEAAEAVLGWKRP